MSKTIRVSEYLKITYQILVLQMAEHPLAPYDVVGVRCRGEVLQPDAEHLPDLVVVLEVDPGLVEEVLVLLHQVHPAEVPREKVFGDATNAGSAVESPPGAGRAVRLQQVL